MHATNGASAEHAVGRSHHHDRHANGKKILPKHELLLRGHAGMQLDDDASSTVLDKCTSVFHTIQSQSSCHRWLRQHSRRAENNTSEVLLITSTGSRSLVAAGAKGFRNTIFASPLPASMWFFHEDSYDRAFNTSTSPASLVLGQLPPAVSRRICSLDLFLEEPWLMGLMTRPDSCIDAYYQTAGAQEPLLRSMILQSGKFLVRKIAALHHAARSTSDGASLLWLDFDVSFVQPPAFSMWT